MTYYLIDGHAVCYRAYYSYATRNLTNSKGFPTNLPYGFLLVLRKLLKDYKPDGLVVTFDMQGGTFRHEKYEDYKAHREPPPDDFIAQLPYLRKILEGYGIPIVEKQGYEADDIMGTLAKDLAKKGHQVVLVTSDKDACQLVNGHVKIMDPGKEYVVQGSKEVVERMGIKPEQIVDYLALTGDASDNIPGVAGIGPKTALELLKEFESLDGVYKNLNKIKSPARRTALETNKDKAELSRELATIDQKVPLDLKIEDLKTREMDVQKLTDVFMELEFRSFLKELPQTAGVVEESHEKKFTLITDAAAWKVELGRLKKQPAFAFDFETTGTDPLIAEPVGISFSYKDHEACFVLFDNHISGQSDLKATAVLNDMKPVFEDPKVKKYGQNIKYEWMMLNQKGIRLKGIDFDTMLASYLLNPSKRNHNLNDLALESLNERLTPIESLIGTGAKQITMAHADLDALYKYGCQDSDVVWRLTALLKKKIKDAEADELMKNMELPLVEVLAEMETAGIGLDVPYLQQFSKELKKSIEAHQKKIFQLAGEEFNTNSTQQLGKILFEKLKLPVMRKTKTGPSTDSDVLMQLTEFHELPAMILEYRELSKLKSTYVDPMPDLVNPNTGRIHTSYNQTVAATGRLSSSDPNLQNIPIRKEEGRKIRKAFVAEKGSVLLAADYSQIELRVMAHLSGDKTLQKAFREGQDIHTYTAGLVFGEKPEHVTPQMRDQAKTVNFGVLYGMGAFSLAKSLKISNEAAKDFIKSYFDRYPKVKEFLDGTIEFARKQGYVETLFKRRRYMPDINSKDVRLKQFAERTAINAPVQGSASDLIKIAMVEIQKILREGKAPGTMLLQVHDELVFEVKKNEVETLAAMVKHQMENAVRMDVPIQVTLKAGANWMDMEKLKVK